MKNTFRFLFAFVLLAGAVLAPGPARAGLFGGGEKSRLLEKADAAYAAAKTAETGYQVVTQMTELRKALAAYRQLSVQYPDYESKKVADRLREVSNRLGAIEEKARRGEITLPVSDLPAAAPPAGGVPASSVDGKKPTEPEAPAYKRPIPVLVRTGGPDAPPPPQPDAGSGADSAWLREALPNPLYGPVPSGVSGEVRVADAAAPRPGAEEPARLGRFAAMIRANKASEAVLELEDAIEREGDAASVGTRAMFVRALLACGNYARAADELKRIPAAADDDPAVLSLRAASAVSQGDLPRALLLLDRLVTKFPGFSDAYVDFAYVRFLSDPAGAEAREEAVTYYKQALMRGSRRDPRLEEELGLRVE